MPSVVAVTVAVSVASLTARAVVIAALALTALVLAGWRKPARAEPRSHRASEYGTPAAPRRIRQATGIAVEHHATPLEQHPNPVRRLLAVVASGGIGVLTGVLAAIIVAFGIALTVIWMTDLLRA